MGTIYFAKCYGGGKWPTGKINGFKKKKKRWRKGKNKTKERRNPTKMSLQVGAKFIFLGGGYILIHMHINIYAWENMMKKIHLISRI